jgi:hypothetical protein
MLPWRYTRFCPNIFNPIAANADPDANIPTAGRLDFGLTSLHFGQARARALGLDKAAPVPVKVGCQACTHYRG